MNLQISCFILFFINIASSKQVHTQAGSDQPCYNADCSGRWSCKDKSACTDLHCSDRDAAKRAGHICKDFPWYNGGYPLKSLPWDDEWEDYDCTTPAVDTAGYCESWTTYEDGVDEFEDGTCTCHQPSVNSTHCSYWTCVQEEISKCGVGEYNEADGSPGGNKYRCCYWVHNEYDSYETCYNVQREIERATCTCQEVSDNGNYCHMWHCEERDDNGIHAVEYEDYTCIMPSPNGLFCWDWEGDIDSSEEFEFSECTCELQDHAQSRCTKWRCYEKGIHYVRPNIAFSSLGVLIACPIFILYIYFIYGHHKCYGDCFECFVFGSAFCWGAGFMMIVLVSGGLGAVFITLWVWLAFQICIDYYFYCDDGYSCLCGPCLLCYNCGNEGDCHCLLQYICECACGCPERINCLCCFLYCGDENPHPSNKTVELEIANQSGSPVEWGSTTKPTAPPSYNDAQQYPHGTNQSCI